MQALIKHISGYAITKDRAPALIKQVVGYAIVVLPIDVVLNAPSRTKLVNMIVTAAGGSITESDFVMGLPVQDTSVPSTNTRVRVTATGGRYRGHIDLHYTRATVYRALRAHDLSGPFDPLFSMSDLIAQLNQKTGGFFTEEEFVPTVLEGQAGATLVAADSGYLLEPGSSFQVGHVTATSLTSAVQTTDLSGFDPM